MQGIYDNTEWMCLIKSKYFTKNVPRADYDVGAGYPVIDDDLLVDSFTEFSIKMAVFVYLFTKFSID